MLGSLRGPAKPLTSIVRRLQRATSTGLPVVLTSMMVLTHPGAVQAQRMTPLFPSVSAPASTKAYHVTLVLADSPGKSETTGLERFVAASAVGVLTMLGVSRVTTDTALVTASYLVGATAGVALATGAREGMRPRSLALGALAGGLTGAALYLARCQAPPSLPQTCESPNWRNIVTGLGLLIVVPLGPTIAHGNHW